MPLCSNLANDSFTVTNVCFIFVFKSKFAKQFKVSIINSNVTSTSINIKPLSNQTHGMFQFVGYVFIFGNILLDFLQNCHSFCCCVQKTSPFDNQKTSLCFLLYYLYLFLPSTFLTYLLHFIKKCVKTQLNPNTCN